MFFARSNPSERELLSVFGGSDQNVAANREIGISRTAPNPTSTGFFMEPSNARCRKLEAEAEAEWQQQQQSSGHTISTGSTCCDAQSSNLEVDRAKFEFQFCFEVASFPIRDTQIRQGQTGSEIGNGQEAGPSESGAHREAHLDGKKRRLDI